MTSLGEGPDRRHAGKVWLAAVLFAAVPLLTSVAQAQQKRYRPQPDYAQFGKPDQEEGRQILAEFRDRGLPANYYLDFRLRIMPKRGEDRWLDGQLWSGTAKEGPITRLVLLPPDGAGGEKNASPAESRYLIQGGPKPAVWRWSTSAPDDVKGLPVEALFEPMAGTDVTPFDLGMPFLFWSEFAFEGVRKVRGRPAYSFLLYPTADIAAHYPALTGIRVYLDTQYNALVQAEHIGDKGRLLKSMNLLDVKKVGERWLPKNVDFIDENTRNKSRFSLAGAALDQEFMEVLFAPARLAEKIIPPQGAVIRIPQ